MRESIAVRFSVDFDTRSKGVAIIENPDRVALCRQSNSRRLHCGRECDAGDRDR